MKKLITLFLALAFGFGLKAQCPLTEAVDFTATDCHGTEVHLFDILDGGQAVLVDFFFASCVPCQQATPKVVESHYAMGCNQHDVFYMEISDRDSDAVCQNWCQNYGVEYPTISGSAGGSNICNQYQIGYYPTVILIMPNREIVIQDLWPINTAQSVITALEQHGLQQHDCNTAPTCEAPTNLVASFDTPLLTEDDLPTINLNWVASETALSYNVYRDGELIANVNETNYADNNGVLGLQEYCYTVTSVCEDDLESDASNESCIIPEYIEISPLDTLYLEFGPISMSRGWSEIDVSNYTTQDLVFGEFTSDEFDIHIFATHPSDFNYVDVTQGFTLPSGEFLWLYFNHPLNPLRNQIYTGYLRVSTSIGDIEWYIIYDTWSVAENEASITLFPNPANDFVTLKGESLGTVRIYNALGQKMDEFEANGSELNINTAGYESGVYIIKAGEATLRFVVKH